MGNCPSIPFLMLNELLTQKASMKLKILVLGIVFLLLSTAGANYWSSDISTNTTSWSIYRQSSNISFNLSSSIEGTISPIEHHGRVLGAYQSHYAEIGSNDVRLRERTSGMEGTYRSEDELSLWSRIDPEVDVKVVKPAGTDVYTFSYEEHWPVVLTSNRTLEYSGRQINDRDFGVNNNDFVSSSMLYNRELTKEQTTVMWLDRMNATVLATDEAIIDAEFQPTKYLGYLIRANTTGIADFSYRMSDSRYDVKRQNYPALSEGEERYYGAFDLARKIEMRSVFEKPNDTTDEEADTWLPTWLPCCIGGWDGMEQSDQSDFGTNAKRLFDCTCFKETTEAAKEE